MQEVSEDNADNFSLDIDTRTNLNKPSISGNTTKEIESNKNQTCIQQNEDDEDEEESLSYHSDSDSTIMMSGNSHFVSKAARYNFLSRSSKF